MSRPSDGFTAVELLIAMVIGVLLLGSAYQLYSAVVRDSGAIRQRAIASNYAYTLVRQYQKNSAVTKTPCAESTLTPSIPSSVGLSPNATASVAITCPHGVGTSINRITATITYFTPAQGQVIRAIYARP